MIPTSADVVFGYEGCVTKSSGRNGDRWRGVGWDL